MKLVEKQSILTVGGSCANCDGDYEAFEGFRMLMEYGGNPGYITEPFNLCRTCAIQATVEGEL